MMIGGGGDDHLGDGDDDDNLDDGDDDDHLDDGDDHLVDGNVCDDHLDDDFDNDHYDVTTLTTTLMTFLFLSHPQVSVSARLPR